ncbi:MAG TPA: antitoxin [Tetrasphaera sp.]|nr:antitoxin [Tetrasphaera sp.]HNQ06111.1 antitoxin [Tetrasphaera sp.]
MSESPNQFGAPNVGDAVTKAKDYTRANPDRARSAIDKLEDFIDER